MKFENLQFTASFKERGALNKLSQLTASEMKRGVIAASAGNHAQGLAYHAQRLGVPVAIVMPVGTPTTKVEHTRHFGAEVIMHGESYDDANAYAREIRAARDLVFVHPFDDLDVIAGQGTVALEMLEDAPELEVLAIPIGGGRPDLGHGHGGQGDPAGHRHRRGGGGHVPVLHRPRARLSAQYRRPDHRRGHRGEDCGGS